MRRRDFITLLGGAAAGWPLAARGQQAAMPVVGFLSPVSREYDAFRVTPFHQGLNESGYVDGQNIGIEYRWADGQYERLPALAAQLVRRQVSVIAAVGGTASAFAARKMTATIPIVFGIAGDPVVLGLVASLSRPGGNLTGVASLGVELGPKQLELLHDLVPAATIVALLVNPTNASQAEDQSREVQAAARTLGLQLHVLHASTERDFDTVFATLAELRVAGLVIGTDAFFSSRSVQLATLVVRHKVPAIFQFRDFVAAGGLMSYGTTVTDIYRQVGLYTGRILKGEKVAELPVHQATKVELSINLKTAKVLGLTVPISLLGRADEVIE